MSNISIDHTDDCHHCPAMAEIISHAVTHATDKDLCYNKSYVGLKKELECQVILTAEYRYVQSSTVISISAFNLVIKVVHTSLSLNSLETVSLGLSQIATTNVMLCWRQRLRGWMILLKESGMWQIRCF